MKPIEFRFPVSQEHIRNLKNPHLDHLSVIHAFVKVKDLPTGKMQIPDKINPRAHEEISMRTRVPQAIEESINNDHKVFHMLNRGCLILAKKAWYDNKKNLLHILIESEEDHGMVDGATTDRVLKRLKEEISLADFSTLSDDEIPVNFREAYVQFEVIAGDIDSDLRIKIAAARNTSLQVQEFSIEDLKQNYDWLKDVIEKSELRGRIRYRENEPEPVDIRTVLAILTLFHSKWDEKHTDPIVAYTGKGVVIKIYQDAEWHEGYKELAPVAIDILKLYDHLHMNFQEQYAKAFGPGSKLGGRKEVRRIEKGKVLPLTDKRTGHAIPDGWIYPLLGSFRALLKQKRGNCKARWSVNPFEFFDDYGYLLIPTIVESSFELGSNPNAVGKSKRVWEALKDKVFRIRQEQADQQ